jgi:hypothetical protein
MRVSQIEGAIVFLPATGDWDLHFIKNTQRKRMDYGSVSGTGHQFLFAAFEPEPLPR